MLFAFYHTFSCAFKVSAIFISFLLICPNMTDEERAGRGINPPLVGGAFWPDEIACALRLAVDGSAI